MFTKRICTILALLCIFTTQIRASDEVFKVSPDGQFRASAEWDGPNTVINIESRDALNWHPIYTLSNAILATLIDFQWNEVRSEATKTLSLVMNNFDGTYQTLVASETLDGLYRLRRKSSAHELQLQEKNLQGSWNLKQTIVGDKIERFDLHYDREENLIASTIERAGERELFEQSTVVGAEEVKRRKRLPERWKRFLAVRAGFSDQDSGLFALNPDVFRTQVFETMDQ